MAIISKSLLLFLFQGTLYWICLQPEKTGPYFVSFAVLFILFVVYTVSCGAMPDLRIKALGLKKMKPDSMPAICYEIENIGDGDARNVQIETRINVTRKKNGGEAFFILIPSQAPKAFLSQGKIMHKSLSFMKRLTEYEIRMVEKGKLILSAYSVIRYKDERRKIHRELRACSVYNPKAQCFEKTFGLWGGEDWSHVGVNQPFSTNYVNC
ncbi:hypothetical protein VU10_02235 [Desulfobulbus sp. US1]|nr:hypothetical protein [Desulfobulbus sp. US2]MCW5209021.1 hypothetical protein [Desulfobulbus sp. US1]MCW5210744.1 hypothetical protein [Desulfobulbus sp. N3]WLE99183.1 MAG: hypothetical protein QTN59_10160 [Candidatus Electrothrix communis]